MYNIISYICFLETAFVSATQCEPMMAYCGTQLGDYDNHPCCAGLKCEDVLSDPTDWRCACDGDGGLINDECTQNSQCCTAAGLHCNTDVQLCAPKEQTECAELVAILKIFTLVAKAPRVLMQARETYDSPEVWAMKAQYVLDQKVSGVIIRVERI